MSSIEYTIIFIAWIITYEWINVDIHLNTHKINDLKSQIDDLEIELDELRSKLYDI